MRRAAALRSPAAIAAGALALAALLLAGPAAAQGRASLPGLGAEDPRRPVADRAAYPWRALGRVQTELGARCTGVAIAPRTVLTAAHCLIAPRTRRPVRPGSVHVLIGYHQGAWAVHARVADFTLGEGYDPARRGPPGADWALLHLADALPSRLLVPLAPGEERPLPAGTPLALAGYQQDRPEVLLADKECRALGPARDRAGHLLLRHDCAGTRGASGAPLLTRLSDGSWAVAGVVAQADGSRAGGVAVPASGVPRP